MRVTGPAIVLMFFAGASSAACRGGVPEYGVSVPIGTGGDAGRGRTIIAQRGCGACHVIPGVSGARGMVGPPLLWFARRTMIAGELPNTPANLIRWVQSPRSVEPNTAMPSLGLSDAEARDVAAYLYTVR